MIRTFLLVLCLLVAAKDDANKKDQDAMQGDWACERFVRDGMAFDDDAAGALFRTVKGSSYTVYRFRKAIGGGTFKLDATKSPRHIDLALSDGPAKGKVIPGIYKLEKDALTLCYAQPGGKRPTEFASKEDSGVSLTVWKREKK